MKITPQHPPVSARRSLLRRYLPTLGAALLGVASALSAQATTVSVTATGASTWIVPADVTSVQIVATGGAGGAGDVATANGGHGGIVTVSLPVTAGQVLNLFVGGGGGLGLGAWQGGGGGGSTNVDAGTAHQIIAGGGGGGAGGAGGAGGNGNGGNGANESGENGGAGGAAGIGGAGGAANGGGNAGNAGSSGNGGAGGASSGAAGVGAGAGTGGTGVSANESGGGGGGFGGGGSGSAPGFARGAGGGGGGSIGPVGVAYSVGTNGGSGAGGDGSITITYTATAPVVATPPPIPNNVALPGVPGIGSQLTVLDLTSGSGPSMTTCLLGTIKQMFGADATYVGQATNGAAEILVGGQTISFYPLEASTGTGLGVGAFLRSDNRLNVGTSCGTFNVVPAVANMADLGTALSTLGLSVQVDANGVFTAMVNGSLYVVRPDYFVTQGTATGTPGLAFGADGVLRFTDSAGKVQILYAAFLDPVGLQFATVTSLGAYGYLIIQADGSGVFTRLNGSQWLLSPEMVLTPVTNGWGSPNSVNDRANHYLYRIAAYYQGVMTTAR